MKVTNISIIICFVLQALFLVSCSKTEYETAKQPYTDVLSVYLSGQNVGNDPLRGVVSKDSIIVYWNPQLTKPENVTPTIQIAKGATISPASGTAVPFNGETTYTVTAENGDSKTYVFKIKTTRETPVFTAVVGNLDYLNVVEGSGWRVVPENQATSGLYLFLLGEYFLTTGNLSDVKVYMQRVHDGFEFDLPIDTATATNTNLRVELPKFSNQQDTGKHRIYVKVGDLVSDSKILFMRAPNLALISGSVTPNFVEENTNVTPGQQLHVKYQYDDKVNGAVTRYYKKDHLHSILLHTRAVERIDTTINPRTGLPQYRYTYRNKTFPIQNFDATENEVKFNIPAEAEEFVGGHISYIQFLYEYINQNGIWTHLSGDMAVQYGQTISMYSQRGTVNYTTIVSAKK
ncbi:hypothetical protein ACFSQ3_09910 [Sphingobacterium corticis]|uniref:DUF5018 domain-containing protein n=1 Tax=Sphingobacterium corticis TaxID=1812823 RepID=A0ABW5NKV3_9SPHI